MGDILEKNHHLANSADAIIFFCFNLNNIFCFFFPCMSLYSVSHTHSTLNHTHALLLFLFQSYVLFPLKKKYHYTHNALCFPFNDNATEFMGGVSCPDSYLEFHIWLSRMHAHASTCRWHNTHQRTHTTTKIVTVLAL